LLIIFLASLSYSSLHRHLILHIYIFRRDRGNHGSGLDLPDYERLENSATLKDRYRLGSSKNQESSIRGIEQSRRGG